MIHPNGELLLSFFHPNIDKISLTNLSEQNKTINIAHKAMTNTEEAITILIMDA